MSLKFYFPIFLILFGFATKHEFYVSVGTLEQSKDGKTLQFSAKYFTDDLEDALTEAFALKNRLELINESRITQYIFENITFKSKDIPLIINYLGFEQEEDVTWIYLEIEKSKDVKTITLKNTMLINVRPKQVNIVHVKSSSTQTLSFDRKKQENTFKL